MTDTKNVQEYINTPLGTEGSLLIVKKIADNLIAEVDKNLIPRSEAAMYFGPEAIPGSSIDVDLETPDSLSVRIINEGAEFPLDASEYTSFNVKPDKYGVAIRITKEMLEDGKWNLLQRNIAIAGKRLAENETSLIISQALDNAANTVAGGAAITISNITTAMQYLEASDYSPSTFFVGVEVLNDLRNIDTFTEADKLGSREMLEKGFVGVLYGMNVIKLSSNAGMTVTTSYVTDKTQAYLIAEKRRITVENFTLPSFDMSGAVVSQRLRCRQVRTQALATITTS